jgi:hypothetical protein
LWLVYLGIVAKALALFWNVETERPSSAKSGGKLLCKSLPSMVGLRAYAQLLQQNFSVC